MKISHNKSLFWTILLLLVVLIGILYVINQRLDMEITNFQECIDAGNPAMESYPRQCRDPISDQTFIEIIDEPIIGGDRDKYGCLGPAGYSYNESVGGCVREWEFIESQKQAAKIAVESLEGEVKLTITEVILMKCPGCYIVKLQNYYGTQIEVEIIDFEVESVVAYCSKESRGSDLCLYLYDPVCSDKNKTFSNSCVACQDTDVEYYINGGC